MQDRIPFPLFFQTVDSQSFKKFLLSLEVGLQSTYQQALAEPPRAAQKIIASCLYKLVNKRGLVYVPVSVCADLLEVLYPYRVKLSHAENFS